MDKRIFKIRYRLYQQIVIGVIGALLGGQCTAFAQGSSDRIVFRDKKSIGSLDSATSVACNDCYTIHKFKVYGKDMQILLPVSITSVNDKKRFNEDYVIQEQTEKDKKVLVVQNNYTSEKYVLVFSGKNNGQWLSAQRTLNASYHYRIAKDDYVDIPSTLICSKEFVKKNRAIPQMLDFRNFDKLKEGGGDCFNCPADLPVEECIKNKKSKIPFKWKW